MGEPDEKNYFVANLLDRDQRPAFAQTQTQTQHHQQQPQDPFKLQKLTETIYALYGRGGNIGFFIGPDSVLVIDSQYRDLAPGIVEKIKSVTDKPIKYLVNTHHHPDHVGGNELFIRFATIIAHDNVRKRVLQSPQRILAEYPKRLEDAKKAGNADAIKSLEEQIQSGQKNQDRRGPRPFPNIRLGIPAASGRRNNSVYGTLPQHIRMEDAWPILKKQRSCIWVISFSIKLFHSSMRKEEDRLSVTLRQSTKSSAEFLRMQRSFRVTEK